MKTLKIENLVHQDLNRLKIDLQLSTLSETIDHLIWIYNHYAPGNEKHEKR